MKKIISVFILFCFFVSGQMEGALVYSQEFYLPAPGVMVRSSPSYNPPLLKGLKIHPDNPFKFDFILNQGDSLSKNVKIDATRLIKYFLASLTIPEKDLWVTY